ncbi:dockerin type I repeat-containing protein [Candidatus Parcubacteria bacterium]|nr:dockerin type I repeat-containing protein [Candidatus Parcubacteria bacterium]
MKRLTRANFRKFGIFILCLTLLSCHLVLAQDFSSNNFTVTSPVIFPGGYSTSSNYSLTGVMSQLGIGTSTSAVNNLFAGFLYFPLISTPAVSTTAGDSQVILNWTAANGSNGFIVSGYTVGRGTSSGGPYTFTTLGNVLTNTQTGLTNSTLYFFIVRVRDGLGNFIATSTEVSASPVQGSGGGGGGGGYSGGGNSGVILSGRAYPLSRVSILKDGQLALTTIAGPDSKFKGTLSGLSRGDYNFSVYGTDKNNIRSSPFTFPVYITDNVTTEISGIFIAPTISVDKSEVKKGDNITIFGQTAHDAQALINVNSNQEYFVNVGPDKDGVYLINFDTSKLDMGDHSTRSKAQVANEISTFSYEIPFIVGNKNVEFTQGVCPQRGDLNGDCRVNLVDFSIAAFWYKKPLSASFKAIENAKLNGDSKIDLTDFSIMAYYWTG